MAEAVTYKIIGNWREGIKQPLDAILYVSQDVMKRTGEEACRHAMLLMIQSASKLTKVAKKNRQVFRDAGKDQYVKVFNSRSQEINVYRFQFDPDAKSKGWHIDGTWENAKKIGNAGLARRAWFWGAKSVGASTTGKGRPINGTSRFVKVSTPSTVGYIKENRLDYILKTMPAGWESLVSQAAANKIMKQAEMKVSRQFTRAIQRKFSRMF